MCTQLEGHVTIHVDRVKWHVILCVCVSVCMWGRGHGDVAEGEYYCRWPPDASWQGHKENRQGVG